MKNDTSCRNKIGIFLSRRQFVAGAFEAGKDIYGEKPITRWIADGIKVRDAVRRYGCVFQTGTMQRSWRQFPQACELVINGYIGRVHTIQVGAPGGTSYPAEPPCNPPKGFCT